MSLRYYENLYYINLGKYGANQPQTEYFKMKINSIKEQNRIENENTLYYNKRSTKGINTNKIVNKVEDLISQLKINSLTKNEIEGQFKNFYFKIVVTNLYEPFMMTITQQTGEKQTLYFEKSGLFKHYGLKGSEANNLLYQEENILE